VKDNWDSCKKVVREATTYADSSLKESTSTFIYETRYTITRVHYSQTCTTVVSIVVIIMSYQGCTVHMASRFAPRGRASAFRFNLRCSWLDE
jgi:hypothetical protein